ncbi:hypothetical protein C8J55DRAFT_607143 [Lentinula edodes]|uniref:Uncharacterized protein n=1 Tax=Lentinula lateritia TaxID=40482 RepID=A0A9W9A4R5_9AGAR|nr:hypothetical protein C8J55DRAFT_607143 [Lentinula edodes]
MALDVSIRNTYATHSRPILSDLVLEDLVVIEKPDESQDAPKIPNYDEEEPKAVECDGLLPLAPTRSFSKSVIFVNVQDIFIRSTSSIIQDFVADSGDASGVLVARDGKPLCWDINETCTRSTRWLDHPRTYGLIFDPLSSSAPSILGDGRLIRAADGLQYGTRDGGTPLVIEVGSADAITTLISLKQELEAVNENKIHLTIFGATESHLLAKELAEAGVGVVVGPVHPFPESWEIRRKLPGPPLSRDRTIGSLLHYNVTVGILPVGFPGKFVPPGNWKLIIACCLGMFIRHGILTVNTGCSGFRWKNQQRNCSMHGSRKFRKVEARNMDLVVTTGGDLMNTNSKVLAILSQRSERVDIF